MADSRAVLDKVTKALKASQTLTASGKRAFDLNLAISP